MVPQPPENHLSQQQLITFLLERCPMQAAAFTAQWQLRQPHTNRSQEMQLSKSDGCAEQPGLLQQDVSVPFEITEFPSRTVSRCLMINHMSETTYKQSIQQTKDDPIYLSRCLFSDREDWGIFFFVVNPFFFLVCSAWIFFSYLSFQLYCTQEWQDL